MSDVMRFSFVIEGVKTGSALVVPMRGEPSECTIGDLVRVLQKRLTKKFAVLKDAPTIVQLILENGDVLDPDVNEEDALDCFWQGSQTHPVTVRLSASAAELLPVLSPEPVVNNKDVDTSKGARSFLPKIPGTTAAAVLPAADSASRESTPPSCDGDYRPQQQRPRRWRELGSGGGPRPKGIRTTTGNQGHQGPSAVKPTPPPAYAPTPPTTYSPSCTLAPAPPKAAPPAIHRPVHYSGKETEVLRAEATSTPPSVRRSETPKEARIATRVDDDEENNTRDVRSAAHCQSKASPTRENTDDVPGNGGLPSRCESLEEEKVRRQREFRQWGALLIDEEVFNERQDRCSLEAEEGRERAIITRMDQMCQANIVAAHQREIQRILDHHAFERRQVEEAEDGARLFIAQEESAANDMLLIASTAERSRLFQMAMLAEKESITRSAIADHAHSALSELKEEERAGRAEASAASLHNEISELEMLESAGRDGVVREEGRERETVEAAGQERVTWVASRDLGRSLVAQCEETERRICEGEEAEQRSVWTDEFVEERLRIIIKEEREHALRVTTLTDEEWAAREMLEATENRKLQMYSRMFAESNARLSRVQAAPAPSPPPGGSSQPSPPTSPPAAMNQRMFATATPPPTYAPPYDGLCESPTCKRRPATTGMVTLGSSEKWCGQSCLSLTNGSKKSVTFRSPIQEEFSLPLDETASDDGSGLIPSVCEPID
eukprot:Sspe_Gene.90370::Locus_61943_Transcript_1_1_Confidence_1.000_Length_2396::g.90370::m.90370